MKNNLVKLIFSIFLLKSIISISQTRGSFFLPFSLPNKISIFLHVLRRVSGSKLNFALITMFRNFGFLGSGQEGVS